ncbi:MAG: lysine N(6)-hydroxylase/L-ornithine N(5)-oxygenase family protein [Actinomycetota bacterium]|nr:lysine N(6)-hydroxylase/L-ornithine N(5)-oxygenase family protein [Actinomycetota bacterium]
MHRSVSVLAIGAGPANLALAVAMEELAPDHLAQDTLIVEQHDDVAWQRGMLLPWTQSQVSFLKDLVTPRNPRSEFSFVNYLHSVGRLDEFINLGTFTPYRLEISRYLQWVANSLTKVRVEYGRTVVAVEPVMDAPGAVRGWLVRFSDGDTIHCDDLIIGAGRDAHIPSVFAELPAERVVHSTQYSSRIADLDAATTKRIVVVGGAQSAAEMLWAAHQGFPGAECTMVMRTIGLNAYEGSKFTNELYYPSFVDEFHLSPAETRVTILQELHRTNYGGLTPTMLETLYREIYQQRLTGTERLRMLTMTDITAAAMVGDDVVISVRDRKTGLADELRCDVVMLGTGFVKQPPRLIRAMADAVGVDTVEVTRSYRMRLPEAATARCYLQGINEATHGIADSLISVLAVRSAEIVDDLVASRVAALSA